MSCQTIDNMRPPDVKYCQGFKTPVQQLNNEHNRKNDDIVKSVKDVKCKIQKVRRHAAALNPMNIFSHCREKNTFCLNFYRTY